MSSSVPTTRGPSLQNFSPRGLAPNGSQSFENPSFRIEIQLKSTTHVHPTSPIKNANSMACLAHISN